MAKAITYAFAEAGVAVLINYVAGEALFAKSEGESTMNSDTDPIVGNWYQRLDKGQTFQVVAVDEKADSVEIQHFDGDVEEMDLDTWYRLELQPIEAPENWSGPLDVAEVDDLTGTEISDTPPEDWAEPLEEVVKPQDQPTEETPEEEDEWGEGYPEEEPLEQEPAAEAPKEPEEEKPRKSIGEAWSED